MDQIDRPNSTDCYPIREKMIDFILNFITNKLGKSYMDQMDRSVDQIRYFDQTDHSDIHIRLNSYSMKHIAVKPFFSNIYVDNYPIRLRLFLDTIF